MLRRLLTLAALAAAVPSAVSAQSAPGADAVVYVRVFGTARAEYEEAWRQTVERRGLEFATGSGFVISPAGYVLTNYHVVSGEEVELKVNGRDVKISITVERIEVVFGSGQWHDASVLAADPSLDLAVLSLAGAADLSYVPFGDSDAIPSGASVTALGYPFGRSLEIGRAAAPETVPAVSVTSGTVSAVRTDDDGQPRFLQVTNALNPGNSGGPLVDADGYAVGVVAMKVTKGDRVGFAIAINRAKDFLEQHGLDSVLPTRRLALGPPTSMAVKGLRLRMPYGFEDQLAHARLRVDAAIAGLEQVALRIDRVASPWSLAGVERALLDGTLVGTKPFERIAEGRASAQPDVVRGRGQALHAGGRALTLEYAIVAMRGEKVVARYVGDAEAIAFNLGVVRASLGSLETEALLRGEPRPPRWGTYADAGRAAPLGPDGWLLEPGAPAACAGTRAPALSHAASPVEDFTQSVRVASWDDAGAAEVIAACKAPLRSDGSYTFQTGSAGVDYVVEGHFLRHAGGVMQIEAVAPRDRAAKLHEWLREWRTALEDR